METGNTKDDTTSTEFLRLFEASQFVKCRWNLLESNSRWGFCHRVLIILHEKRKAKKQTKTKQNRAETSIQPLLDKYLDEPQLCSLPRRRTFGSLCNRPSRTCDREEEKRVDTFRTSAQEGTVLLCGGSSLPWSATVWFILVNVFACIDSKWKPTKQMQSTPLDTGETTESIRPY